MLPLFHIQAGHFLLCIITHQGPPVILFAALAHAGAHYATLATEQLEVLVADHTLLEFLDCLLEVYPSLRSNYISAYCIIVGACGLKQAPCHREYCAAASEGRIKLRRYNVVGLYAHSLKHLPELKKGYCCINLGIL